MDDSNLTKKAIEELMREMEDYRKKGVLISERKRNPLGKPNKLFLGRTISSIMAHNKRQGEYNYKRCQDKLKKLDAKRKKREFSQSNKCHQNEFQSHKNTESSHENSNESDSDYRQSHRKIKTRKKNNSKRKNRHNSYASSSSSSSSTSSSETESNGSTISSAQSKSKTHKKKRHKKYENDAEYKQDYQIDLDPGVSYYVDPNIAYAAMAYSQMNHILQQQQIAQQEIVNKELVESVEIPSDLSISCTSDDSLNISLNSSSAEEDENGVLTFKLLSSDEERVSSNSKAAVTNYKKNVHRGIASIMSGSDESDEDSLKSHISIESVSSQTNTQKECKVFLLSSSSSDSKDLEIVETIIQAVDSKEKYIDDVNEKNNVVGKPNKISEEIKTAENVYVQNLPEKENESKIMDTKNLEQKGIVEENANMVNSIINEENKNPSTNITMVDLTDD